MKPSGNTRFGRLSLLLFAASPFFMGVESIMSSAQPLAYRSVAAIKGYDGCACGDCALYFVGFMPRYPLTWRAYHWSSDIGFLAGAACALMGLGFGVCAAVRFAHRSKPGRCAHCDYDLAGLPTGQCPECGYEVSEY